MPGRAAADGQTLPLKGEWRFQLDAGDVGVAEKWFSRNLEDSVQLPGTTDENRKGIQKDEGPTDRLARIWYWKGPAWYQREVTIPDSWEGKHITLILERSKNTRLWVDGEFCGWDDTLSAPQIYDLTSLAEPGRHTITLLIDNAKTPPGTLGILCDPNHPALARFPTEFHTNWQWWHLVKNSRPIVLDDTEKG